MKCWNFFFISLLFICFIIIISPEVNSQTEIPVFSVSRGFYEQSFDVIVSSQLQGAFIKYTMDGSDPVNSQTAQLKNSPATIRINPDSSYGVRGKNAGVILRACTVAPDNSVSQSVTHTYLFINKVDELSPDGSKPGSGWPNPTTTGQQWINYGMDPDVLNDPRYSNLIDDALLAIPSISIVTDLKNLFSPDSGIYMNAMNDGSEWERPTSLELLNPDGTEGFQINAGIRIRGGWSRHGDNPKHAFRFFFRNEYGKGKLEYPLFGDEGVDEFDKIDLRTSQNYSWSYAGHMGEYNVMNRDVFSRDLQRETGQPYTRSRYYHIYINGYYWGLFQTQERPEARYAASYFGGNVEDYDVIKAGFPNYTVEATDGNLNAWQSVWNLCVTGFQTNTNYFKLLGANPDGTNNPSYKKLVDIDNLIDYMLIIFLGGNYDSPTSKFLNNESPNNFFCIYNRNGNEGFKFFIHDAEHTLRTTYGEGPGIGLQENRVDIQMSVDFSRFHPQWLHNKLTSNTEYRVRFADHVYKHFFNLGSMIPQKTSVLFQLRANEIEMAIIGESARWGDVYYNPARTKDDDWQWAIDDILNNYFPYRTNIVLNQIKNKNLYPDINPPIFKNNDEEILVTSLNIEPGYIMKLVNSNGTTGSVIYSIDNKDPREIGGNVSVSSVDGGDETEITINQTTVLKSRVKNGAAWSALHEIILFVGDEFENLKITEIHYHPLDSITVTDTINDDEYEFLELKNIGNVPIVLSQATFLDGISYTFPSGTTIQPDNFIVLASNQDEFQSRYSFLPFGDYSAQLNNGGETLSLVTPTNDTIFSVTYSDQNPWPESPDGDGFSLVTAEINPVEDQNDPANWRASYKIHGSPGSDDLVTSVKDEEEFPVSIELFQNYPNPFNPETMIHYAINTRSKVRLSVFDILGREIKVLVNRVQNAGRYSEQFSGSNLASGIYFYMLQTENKIFTKKMILMK